MNHGLLLFNPRSAEKKYRIPNSVLQIAASIDGVRPWAIVDGNRETDPLPVLMREIELNHFRYVGFTVMPGPQLKQAIPFGVVQGFF